MMAAIPYCCHSASPHCKNEDRTHHFSRLVYPGKEGRLVYTPDEKGNTIPDFSYAGYCGGGVRLPKLPVKAMVKPGGGNDAGRIQEAIDRVSALAPDKKGFRGAVLIKRGRYELDKPLRIAASGVVLRGEGQGEDGTVLFGKGAFKGLSFQELQRTQLIVIRGPEGVQPVAGSARQIRDEYVPVGARDFRVERADGFHADDRVLVRRHGNRAWIHEVGMDLENKEWAWEPMTHDFDRIVTRVEGDRITVDAPLTCAIESRWGGGEIIPYNDLGRISQVGVENLRGESDFNRSVRTNKFGNMDRPDYTGFEYYSDEEHYWNFVTIDNACNAWVRDITALHFAFSTVLIGKGAKWVTVQDCTTREPVSLSAGSRRFTYHIQGQLSLVQRCVSDRGRHSFVLQNPTACGPNVFLDCVATHPYGSSEPHSRYSVGALYDNIQAPLTARFWKEISIGWAGANCVFWNCEGMFLVQKPPTAQNYAIGHTGIHAMIFNTRYMDYNKEDGYIESLDEKVQPGSLYRKQLEDRLGKKAVRNIERNE